MGYEQYYENYTLHALFHIHMSIMCLLGIVAVSVGEPYSLNERIELSFKLVHSNSLVLLWSFTDPIHPQVHTLCMHL